MIYLSVEKLSGKGKEEGPWQERIVSNEQISPLKV